MKTTLLEGLRVGVLGLGRSGIAAANLANAKGASVLVSEAKAKTACKEQLSLLEDGIEQECGGHSDLLLQSDIIIKSPGIHHAPILDKLTGKGTPVWSEIELALRFLEPRNLFAITGTNGKTTTTTLVGEILKATRQPAVVAGNIGTPLASLVDEVTKKTSVVLEVSSYQLEDSPTFRPTISTILNITPDHLEHHKTMKNYVQAKALVFARQTKKDYCILNHDDPYCRKLAEQCPAKVIFFSCKKALPRGIYYNGTHLIARLPGLTCKLSAALAIPGLHNIENALAAAAMTLVAGVRPALVEKVITSFPGVEHRIELARELGGVRYFNDSKATNVDSTFVALKSFNAPIWLILGGRDKGSPYTPLKALIKRKVKGILLIGEAAPRIKKDLRGLVPFYESKTLAKALQTGQKLAQPGDIVLLSPACASFDQFRSYEDRGRVFKQLVQRLHAAAARPARVRP